jgi:hypothetical protein
MHKFLPHTSKTIYVGELKTRKEGALWYIAAYRPILINAVIEKHTVLLIMSKGLCKISSSAMHVNE